MLRSLRFGKVKKDYVKVVLKILYQEATGIEKQMYGFEYGCGCVYPLPTTAL